MQNTLIFDFHQQHYMLWIFLIGCTVCSLKWLPLKKDRAKRGFIFHIGSKLVDVVILPLFLLAFYSAFADYNGLAAGERSSQYKNIKGVIHGIEESPGGKSERFCVDSTCFEYLDATVFYGFHSITSRGGIIRNGMKVKIGHIGNRILRIELCR